MLSPLAGSINWLDPAASPPATVVYNPGDIAWVLASTALVWIMVPGVGFFYSGLLRCVSSIPELHNIIFDHPFSNPPSPLPTFKGGKMPSQ